jgi:hypothetical protein
MKLTVLYNNSVERFNQNKEFYKELIKASTRLNLYQMIQDIFNYRTPEIIYNYLENEFKRSKSTNFYIYSLEYGLFEQDLRTIVKHLKKI